MISQEEKNWLSNASWKKLNFEIRQWQGTLAILLRPESADMALNAELRSTEVCIAGPQPSSIFGTFLREEREICGVIFVSLAFQWLAFPYFSLV